jgi:hypothetical protein
VTVPKAELVNIAREDEFSQLYGDVVEFWAIRRKPKDLNIGDRVYFVQGGVVSYYHLFMGFVYDPVCEVTGRVWRGLNLLLKCPEIKLEHPIPHNSFRGFHYTERIE